MTEREMLELAAKAAGIHIDKSETNGGGRGNTGFDIMGNAVLDWHSGKKWDPLADDGDALRLAVKLNMGVSIHNNHCMACAPSGMAHAVQDMPKEQAIRLAITRAAAEIGKHMGGSDV